MDEGLSRAVLKVFVTLYNEGLIYKDKRLVNWDPKLLTAISDLEVQQVEVRGHLWHIRYPLEGKTFNPEDRSTFIVVATTRPETMLGDVAVAVHPGNERYQGLVGDNVDPAAGRPQDSDCRRRLFRPGEGHRRGEDHAGARLQRLRGRQAARPAADQRARRRRQAFAERQRGLPRGRAEIDRPRTRRCKLHGVDRFKARKIVVERLEDAGLMDKIEPHTHMVPHGDRSNVVIEPFLTDQWYVNAKALAVQAIAAVREGKTNFVPKNWEKTYFDWMENIQPWCISRQLWWGHQIPAWYGPDGKVFVAELRTVAAVLPRRSPITLEDRRISALGTRPTQLGLIASRQSARRSLQSRDEDVLDTWFSSALWPFSTLGWPDDTPEVKRFYPTSALVTGFDIIFFWVARMMMMGLHFMKEVPFKDVYIHRLVRDEKGAKMSKSKGNVVDPLGIIDDYGADALRFTLARGRGARPRHQAVAAVGREQPQLRDQAVERRALRRVQRRRPRRGLRSEVREGNAQPLDRPRDREGHARGHRGDRAIPLQRRGRRGLPLRLERLLRLVRRAEQALAHRAGRRGQGRDPRHGGLGARRNPEAAASVHAVHHRGVVAGHRRDRAASATALLVLSPWPKHDGLDDAKAEAEIGWLIDLVTAIRSVRVGDEHPGSTPIPVVLAGASAETKARAERWAEFAKRLARLADITFADAAAAGLGAASDPRRGRGAAAQGRDRLRRRAGAARQGIAEGRSRHQARRRRSSAIRSSSPTRPRRSSRASRRSARRPKPAAARSSRRWSG